MIGVKELSVFLHIIGAGLVLQLSFPALRQVAAGIFTLVSSTRYGGRTPTEKDGRPKIPPTRTIWCLLICMACGCFIASLRVVIAANNGFLLERCLQFLTWVRQERCSWWHILTTIRLPC